MKNKYTLVAITENKNLHKLFEEKKNFLNKIKHNSFVYSNTRIIVMSYTNIYYFSNISDSLEKQSNFLSLYNNIEETRITIQRKNKSHCIWKPSL